jgi:hypothetical protein
VSSQTKTDPLVFDCFAQAHSFEARKFETNALEDMTSQIGYESTNEIQHGAMSLHENVSLFSACLMLRVENLDRLVCKRSSQSRVKICKICLGLTLRMHVPISLTPHENRLAHRSLFLQLTLITYPAMRNGLPPIRRVFQLSY